MMFVKLIYRIKEPKSVTLLEQSIFQEYFALIKYILIGLQEVQNEGL